eukprot:8233766-Lingulodinium_polyedra.AAC.1
MKPRIVCASTWRITNSTLATKSARPSGCSDAAVISVRAWQPTWGASGQIRRAKSSLKRGRPR